MERMRAWNIGPKGFTGEKYGGATYWDTEAYCLPMYTAIAGEEVARNLLQYRWLQLDGAYHNARQQGLPARFTRWSPSRA